MNDIFMDFNGQDETQNFVDKYGLEFIPSNDLVKLTASDKRSGITCAKFRGGHLSCNQVSSLGNRFTIEFWWKHERTDKRNHFIEAVNDAGYGLIIRHYGPSNRLRFHLSSNGVFWNITNNSQGTKNDWINDIWYKIIFNFDGLIYRCFVASKGLLSLDWFLTSPKVVCPITTLNIGERRDKTPLYGKMDEFKATLGFSKYASFKEIIN